METFVASLQYARPAMFQQNFPSAPTFTEKDLPDLTKKVYIVTGANAGIGKELARLLYSANATVYMACRSENKAQAAIEEIKAAAPKSNGVLVFLPLDLADLTTVKPAAEAFLAKEEKLHVLFNNAGVMNPPEGQKTTQGYELQLGVNCVAPFLFTQLLTPKLVETAKSEPAGTVRVVWVASMAIDLYSIKGGVDVDNLKAGGYVKEPKLLAKYGISKAGNYFHGTEYARRYKKDGVISVVVNPGNLDSELYRYVGKQQSAIVNFQMSMFTKYMLHPVVHGAYTELFGGLSPLVTLEKTGSYVGPFGRFFSVRKDVAAGLKAKSAGGKSTAERFWDWTEQEVKSYL